MVRYRELKELLRSPEFERSMERARERKAGRVTLEERVRATCELGWRLLSYDTAPAIQPLPWGGPSMGEARSLIAQGAVPPDDSPSLTEVPNPFGGLASECARAEARRAADKRSEPPRGRPPQGRGIPSY